MGLCRMNQRNAERMSQNKNQTSLPFIKKFGKKFIKKVLQLTPNQGFFLKGAIAACTLPFALSAWATAVPAPQMIQELCAKGSLTHQGLREKLLKEVLIHDSLRGALAKEVEKPGNPCRAAVVDYLEKLQTNAKAEERYEGRFAFVALGVVARLPEAVKVIEKEIVDGSGNEWLSALAALDGPAYLRTLRTFVGSAAADIRKAQNFQTTAGQPYSGAALESHQTSERNTVRDAVRVVSPLVIDRYLRALLAGKIPPTNDDFASTNALFAGSNASYRQIFEEPLKKIIVRHTQAWIASFRSEATWVQFRLFPLMAAVGGPEMVRELMWLSSHHSDSRVRMLASRTLDDAVTKSK